MNDVDINSAIQQELLIVIAALQNRKMSARINLGQVKVSVESDSRPKILTKMTGGWVLSKLPVAL